MGSKTKKSKRGRKLLVLAVIGLGAVAYKATRSPAGAAPQAWTPAPAPTPTPAPAPVVEPDVQSEASPIEQLETEAPAPLAEPIVEPDETPAPPEADVSTSATDGLHDIVEEPWVEETPVTPVAEVPEDSLTSFFDEVMTDTAERKLRKGR